MSRLTVFPVVDFMNWVGEKFDFDAPLTQRQHELEAVEEK